MELSAHLSAQLSTLAADGPVDGTRLREDLSALTGALAEAVSGFAGLRVTIRHSGYPVRVLLLAPGVRPDAVTSVRLPLRLLTDRVEEDAELVVWSRVPGALVDLAADLTHVLQGPRAPGGRDRSPVVLDADLPMPSTSSAVEGLEELATVQRAVGLLIARGHDPASVQATLRHRAAAAGLTPYAFALRLLRPNGQG